VAIELPAVRILIVDDDRAICDYMQTPTRKGWVSSQNAERSDGSSSRDPPGGYHLLILDLMMPHLDGIEVLQTIAKSTPTWRSSSSPAIRTWNSAVASMKLDAVDYIKSRSTSMSSRSARARHAQEASRERPKSSCNKVIGTPSVISERRRT